MTLERRSNQRRRVHRWIALGVLVGLLAIAVPSGLAIHEFTDVPDANPFHGDISAIKGAGITSGKTCVPPGTPPTYCPTEGITREAMAAFVHRGFGRVAFGGESLFLLPTTQTPVNIAEITLAIGGAPGGTQFVKVDGAVGTSITSTSGCPCDTGYYIDAVDLGQTTFLHRHTNVDVAPGFGGGDWGEEHGTVSAVFAVPTGSMQTFRVLALRPAGSTGNVSAFANLTAIVAPFGSTGGSALGVGAIGASKAPFAARPPSPPSR
jgi:hypothetical protein